MRNVPPIVCLIQSVICACSLCEQTRTAALSCFAAASLRRRLVDVRLAPAGEELGPGRGRHLGGIHRACCPSVAATGICRRPRRGRSCGHSTSPTSPGRRGDRAADADGARKNAALRATWADVNLQRRVLNVPADRSNTGRPRHSPPSPFAL
jgi:hypothetical protein